MKAGDTLSVPLYRPRSIGALSLGRTLRKCLFLFLLLGCIYRFSRHNTRATMTPSDSEVYMTIFSPDVQPNSTGGVIDYQFEATSILAYRLLRKQSTRDPQNRRLIVLTTDVVSQEQIRILQSYGADVRTLNNLGPLPPTLADPYYHWSPIRGESEFIKLQIWNMTEYSKILYLNADTLPLRSLAPIFATPLSHDVYDGSYLFAAVSTEKTPQNFVRLDDPTNLVPNDGLEKGPYELFDAAMFLIRPSIQHSLYLASLYYDPRQADRFPDRTEQSLLRFPGERFRAFIILQSPASKIWRHHMRFAASSGANILELISV
jgi:alpha-N-acetylglucosamine transferase